MKYRWDHGLSGLAYDGNPELYAAQQGASFLESLVKEVIFQVTHCALTLHCFTNILCRWSILQNVNMYLQPCTKIYSKCFDKLWQTFLFVAKNVFPKRKSSLQRICSTEIFLFQLLWSSKAEQLKNPKNATGFVMKSNFYPQFNSFLLWNQEQAWSKSNKFKHVVKNWSL